MNDALIEIRKRMVDTVGDKVGHTGVGNHVAFYKSEIDALAEIKDPAEQEKQFHALASKILSEHRKAGEK